VKIGVASADYLRPEKSPTGKEQWGGAGWARIGQYIPYLREAGHEVTVGTMWKSVDHIEVADAYTKERVSPDLILIQRIMHDGVDGATRLAQKAGQVVVHDIDDWYWALDPRNNAWKATHPKYNKEENTVFYARNVASCDFVISSTPYIAGKVREKFGVPTTVLKNTVDTAKFTTVDQPDTPTIGWVGSTAHRSGDLEILSGIFPQFLRNDSLKLLHAGHYDGAPKFADALKVDEALVETTPLRPSYEYAEMLTMNVGLVPLNDIPFNHAKSDIKGLEYASAGIPFIASPLSAYKELYDDWGTGFMLAKRPRDWVKAITKMLDKGTRVEHQQALLELVRQRDIAHGAKALIDLLESMK
jgi:glycosyltransferase involved in cell wall biosynthesis